MPRFSCLWGLILPTSKEVLADELLHTKKLDFKHRGELAELAFMRKAAALGFAVAKPWGDSDRYDVVLRCGKIFWRVQVKSVWGKPSGRSSYRVRTSTSIGQPYSSEDIDFLVAYVFPEDIWYVFPATVVEHHVCVYVCPGSKRSPNEQYREAWKLMECPAPAGPPEVALKASAAAAP